MKNGRWVLYFAAWSAGWLMALIAAAVMIAQEKPKTFTPTEVQSLRLQVKQRDALLAKERLEALQQAVQTQQKTFQDALKALTDEGEAVKKEQGWPKETVFEPNQLSFSDPAKKEEPKK